ncbi:MAG: hypothetical protein E6I71_03560 [Chloroflexi bacterium]|nr:MAG: hypothetical protein E6I71_03560 [Chloroflexota bacterium]
MPELEQQLTSLARAIDWPPTPRLSVVLPIYGEVAGVAGRRGWRRWPYALAAGVLIVATLLAYTPTRDVIAGWLNLHTTIHREQHPPTPSPRPPGQLGSNLGLGTAVTLNEAQSQVSWKIAVPSALGRPDAVYLKQPPNGPSQGEVTLVYGQSPGIKVSGQTGVAALVTEARGQINENYFQKTLGPDSTLERVSVGGHIGYWIAGHPHDFVFTDANGNFQDDALRLATNTLIFDHDGTIVRIEGDMTKAQALQIAGSI